MVFLKNQRLLTSYKISLFLTYTMKRDDPTLLLMYFYYMYIFVSYTCSQYLAKKINVYFFFTIEVTVNDPRGLNCLCVWGFSSVSYFPQRFTDQIWMFKCFEVWFIGFHVLIVYYISNVCYKENYSIQKFAYSWNHFTPCDKPCRRKSKLFARIEPDSYSSAAKKMSLLPVTVFCTLFEEIDGCFLSPSRKTDNIYTQHSRFYYKQYHQSNSCSIKT